MKYENPISPQALKDNAGGRHNGTSVPSLAHSEEVAWKLQSTQVSEILSQPPSWLIRWGITVFFCVLMVILMVSWFVEYPDLVKGHLRLVATNFPKSVHAKAEGVLTELLVKEGIHVRKGQHLGFIESTANPYQVLGLDTVANLLVKWSSVADLEQIHREPIPLYFQLGELQKSYQTFQDAYIRSKVLLKGGVLAQKKNALQQDLVHLELLRENLQTQLSNYQKDFELTADDLRMNRALHKEKVVADIELRRSQSQYLSKKQTVDQAQTNFNNNGMAQNQKQQELIELEKGRIEQLNGLFQSINTLKSDIEAWKQRYVMVAPTNGKVSFFAPLQAGQTLQSGQELFYILPEGSDYGGEMYVGQYNFGKVKRGQEVIIKFASYPYQEFGSVSGRISTISAYPKDTAYLVKITFPQGLLTSSQKKLAFRNGMTASGEIVTEELKLIERFFYQFRQMLK